MTEFKHATDSTTTDGMQETCPSFTLKCSTNISVTALVLKLKMMSRIQNDKTNYKMV